VDPSSSPETAAKTDASATAAHPRLLGVDVDEFRSLLDRLGIATGDGPLPEDVFGLRTREGALDLRPPGAGERAGIRARFPPDRAAGVTGARAGRRASPLARAFGSRIGVVIDATAGLGADAYLLAQAGYRVHAVERHPAVYALLASGWAEAQRAGRVPADVIEQLDFAWGDAAALIEGIEERDVGVYLDPMYPPPRKRSALPKRELQVLRQLLGEERDAARELLERARARAARVVVKRPPYASPLAPGASFELESKLVRFDVYTNPARMAGGAS